MRIAVSSVVSLAWRGDSIDRVQLTGVPSTSHSEDKNSHGHLTGAFPAIDVGVVVEYISYWPRLVFAGVCHGSAECNNLRGSVENFIVDRNIQEFRELDRMVRP